MTELVTQVANVSLTLSFVVALIFGVSQVKVAARDRKERLTLDTLKNFHSREATELMLFMLTQKLPQNVEELRALPMEMRVMFTQFAQQMESLGLLVAENYIDLDLVDKTFGDTVSKTWHKCENVFKDLREKQNDPNAAEYFQWLAEHIEARIKNNPRPAYYLNKN